MTVDMGVKLLTAAELAERLRVKPDTVRDWARRGLIPSVKLGHKTIRYQLTAVVEAMVGHHQSG